MDIIIACIGIFLGEIYGNFVGGGSIVTQFFLQGILGMDIKTAIALDNAAVIGSEFGMLIMLLKSQKIEKYYAVLVGVGMIGASIGAYMLHLIPIYAMQIIFVGVLLCIVAYNFLSKSDYKKEKGFVPTTTNIACLSLAIFGISVYNAFMSVGDFIIGLVVLTSLFHFKYHRALFILSFVWVAVRITATYSYFQFGYIQWDYFIPMFVCALIAGLTVGHLVTKIKSEILEKLLKYLSVLLVIYLITSLF